MITVRLVFEAVMVELSKIQAPTLKLFEFNYLINKAILQFVNKEYNFYDTTLQTTDNISVLKKTKIVEESVDNNFKLDEDYLHLLNCICVFKFTDKYKCWKKDQSIEIPATKITSDSWGSILTDYYNKPSFKKPYFNIYSTFIKKELENGLVENLIEEPLTLSSTIKLSDIIKPQEIKESIKNAEIQTFCKIECGDLPNKIELQSIKVDYLKKPKEVKLTQEQVDLIEDTSEIMEFPDYVNHEIINELVHLAMERSKDPRLTTHYLMTLSIAKPTGQLTTNQN